MKKILIVCTLLVSVCSWAQENASLTQEVAPTNCDDLVAVGDVMECLIAQLKTAQIDLEKSETIVRESIKNSSDPAEMKAEKLLLFENLAVEFQEYAEARCKWNATQMMGGSQEQLILVGCAGRLVKERLKRLKESNGFDI